jgi:hypothetical protein
MTDPRKPAEPWDTEKAAELAAEAMRYLARHYPECSDSEALRPYEAAAYDAAMDADEEKVQGSSQGFYEGRPGRDPRVSYVGGGMKPD